VLHETHIPVVFTDRPGDDLTDFVGINNLEETEKIVSAFKNKPKRITAFSPNDIDANTKMRIEGVKTACEKLKIDFEIITLSKDQKDTDKVIQEQIKKGSDSFIALNSRVIFKLISGLKTLNQAIGKDLKLISFDDHESFGYMTPSISALRQPISDLAVHSAERMVARLADDSLPFGKQIILPCEFIERESH